MMPGQEKMVMEFYQKNPSALASLRGNVYEEKIINLIKSKAKANKKNITKVEAEQILKEANSHNHPHDHFHEESDKKKTQSKTKPQPAKKTKSITSKTKKAKKVSKK
jgi:trigger factor